MPRAVLAVTLTLLLGTGCGGGGARREPAASATATASPARACTQIGCLPEGVDLSLNRAPRGAAVTLCVARRCVTEENVGPGAEQIGDFLPRSGDSVRVAVVVRRGGRVIARAVERLPVRTERPNGPDCPPVCRFVRAQFDVPSEVLEPL